MKHLSFEDLVAAAEAAPAKPPLPHLASCPSCAAEAERVAALLVSLRSGRRFEPPAAVLARAHSLFPDVAARPAAERLVRWLAALVFDSSAPALAAAPAGLRGAQPAADVRQLLFAAPRVDLDVSLPGRAASPPFTLRGQALGRGPGDAGLTRFRPVVLSDAAGVGAPRSAATDALGAFRFDALEPGRYRLELELEEGVVCAELELGDSGRTRQ